MAISSEVRQIASWRHRSYHMSKTGNGIGNVVFKNIYSIMLYSCDQNWQIGKKQLNDFNKDITYWKWGMVWENFLSKRLDWSFWETPIIIYFSLKPTLKQQLRRTLEKNNTMNEINDVIYQMTSYIKKWGMI